MAKRSTIKIALDLEGNTEVFKRSILSSGIEGLKVEEIEGEIILSVENLLPYKLLKTSHTLVGYSVFILKTLKELDTLEEGKN